MWGGSQALEAGGARSRAAGRVLWGEPDSTPRRRSPPILRQILTGTQGNVELVEAAGLYLTAARVATYGRERGAPCDAARPGSDLISRDNAGAKETSTGPRPRNASDRPDLRAPAGGHPAQAARPSQTQAGAAAATATTTSATTAPGTKRARARTQRTAGGNENPRNRGGDWAGSGSHPRIRGAAYFRPAPGGGAARRGA